MTSYCDLPLYPTVLDFHPALFFQYMDFTVVLALLQFNTAWHFQGTTRSLVCGTVVRMACQAVRPALGKWGLRPGSSAYWEKKLTYSAAGAKTQEGCSLMPATHVFLDTYTFMIQMQI